MGPFGTALAQQGAAQIGNLANAGMGLALGGLMDKRQLRQQEKLQKLQIAGQVQMGQHNLARQLELWEKTNFKAQMEQLKMAGLNPGLIYGMHGAGGTTAAATPGTTSGGQAPVGGREVQDMMGMGMQLQLLKAQKENIEADTKQKLADAQLKGGPQTKSIEADTELKLQGLDNLREDWEVKRLQQALMHLQIRQKDQTLEDSIDNVKYNTRIALENLERLMRENKIGGDTLKENINIIKANAVKALMENDILKEQFKGITLDNAVKELDTQMHTATGIDSKAPSWLKILARLFLKYSN